MKATELRMGNRVMQKVQHRIQTVSCTIDTIALVAGGSKEVYPILLKAAVLESCGFKENKDYALLPSAHEYRLVLPVSGSGSHEITAYIKTNGECFARAVFNNVAVSNPVYHLHALQNLYYALTGEELEVR